MRLYKNFRVSQPNIFQNISHKISQINAKGGPFESVGVRILKKKEVSASSAPKTDTADMYQFFIKQRAEVIF